MQCLFHLKHEDTAKPPTTKLVTLLFKALRLSQASLELSSSRGVFGRLENERKKREKRAKCNLKKPKLRERLNRNKVRLTKVIRWLI